MRQLSLPETGTFSAWREASRGLLAEAVPPEDVLWTRGPSQMADMFAGPETPVRHGRFTVPKAFVDVACQVVWHRDPERFARLYALLWRLRDQPRLMSDRGDEKVAKVQAMAKEVGRDTHKMTAFVRFREVSDGGERRKFAAWFEPSHFIMEPITPFFEKRFGDMDWSIFTPDLTAHFINGKTRFAPGQPKPPIPDDATEELWRTYFKSIFNPARLKPKAMQAEMPKKYWKNMPEAQLIPGLIASARTRAQEMADAAPTLPPARAARISRRIVAERETPDDIKGALAACRRCPLWQNATQPVAGEGPLDARIMIVGEAPGDREDLEGRPFVGPAGQLFDKVAKDAGLDRTALFITNAVKHFKFTPRGRRRIHQNPDAHEIQHCKWWLDLERETVKPALIVAMGGTALQSLTGSRKDLLKRRGGIERTGDGTPILVTVHPSYILRLPDAHRADETARFRADLARAAAFTPETSPQE
ncbi:MAG: UdgX family uracil-DNA binding protein [Silicimonas sp.]|nr:UdgX family uracil-DNA binding protein [Silicimonas sp.]